MDNLSFNKSFLPFFTKVLSLSRVCNTSSNLQLLDLATLILQFVLSVDVDDSTLPNFGLFSKEFEVLTTHPPVPFLHKTEKYMLDQ